MPSFMPAAPAASLSPVTTQREEFTAAGEQLIRQAPAPARSVLRALVAAQTQHKLFAPGQALVVAVSGGADSICLLHALHQLAAHWQVALHVAHVDHALRPEAAADAAFVAAFAQQLALPFHSTRLTPGILDDDVRGVEAAARSARYAFLRQIAEAVGAMTIATAHHQDDQAETLLLHLIQGSGLAGLAGMAWVGHLPDDQEPALRLVRPLLATRRADIRAYLQSYGVAWCEDSSNDDLAYLRNQLRHQLLPLLATFNPNIQATLARTAELLAAEAAHVAQRDRTALAAATTTLMPSTRIVLDLFRLTQSDLATQRGVLRQALLDLGVDLREVGLEKIDAMLEQSRHAVASGPHPLVAGWQWTLLHESDAAALALHRADALPAIVAHPHLGAPLATPRLVPAEGAIQSNRWQLQSSLLDRNELPADWRSRGQPWRLFADAERCGDLYLTTFEAGMAIAPLGMDGHQRMVGDIFTDHKIPPYLRPGWPVVINGDGKVIWLCGLVVSELIRVHSNTQQVRQLFWLPIAQPSMAEPNNAQPSMAEPNTAKPAMAEPNNAQPAMAEPNNAQPSMAEPNKQ